MDAPPSSTAVPLTPKRIEALKPLPGQRYEVPDSAASGLRVRVLPTGTKVFLWRLTSEKRVINIGRFSVSKRDGHITLADARLALERLKDAYRAGKLEDAEAELPEAMRKKRTAKGASEEGALTVQALAADFMKLMERRRKRPDDIRYLLEKNVLPGLGERAVKAVSTRDCRRVVEVIVERGSTRLAGQVLAAMKQMFRFAQARDDIPSNPAEPLDGESLGCVNNVCNRSLSAEELPLFWNALDASGMSPSMRTGLRILLATGVRVGELCNAQWKDVDLEAGLWTVPVENQKMTKKAARTAKPWVVPLSPLAASLFQEMKACAGESPWVWASPASKHQRMTNRAPCRAVSRLFEGSEPLLTLAEPHPTPHDLRRTVRTHLGALGVPWHVAERALNHSVGGMSRVYDVHDYLEERRAALEKWAAYLERLISPAEANVAFLPVAGAA